MLVDQLAILTMVTVFFLFSSSEVVRAFVSAENAMSKRLLLAASIFLGNVLAAEGTENGCRVERLPKYYFCGHNPSDNRPTVYR